jgi:hypothetical protein
LVLIQRQERPELSAFVRHHLGAVLGTVGYEIIAGTDPAEPEVDDERHRPVPPH